MVIFGVILILLIMLLHYKFFYGSKPIQMNCYILSKEEEKVQGVNYSFMSRRVYAVNENNETIELNVTDPDVYANINVRTYGTATYKGRVLKEFKARDI
ncbi:hypothetical protein M3194_00060 [Paenibacillus glycanilyticus]|uniref:hypothetical protein n=1 Tax=Paenibacillus glycanilyticus TaxID=126569 RepID=UPI00203C5A69|nr:hypothetical protein [Paenibacillus glycanilyticus]MCM3625752.1 hypothetical protein [Paenibacillus glycanilyticus]